MELYPHNQYAYDVIRASLISNDKVCIVQPTGTGKSYITAAFLKENPDKKFLLLTSNYYIINQFNTSFEQLSNYTFIAYPSLLSSTFDSLLKENFDYIVLDEFHRVGADIWGSKVSQLIQVYKCKVIGLTATHIRYSGEDRDLVKELFNGNLVHHLTLMECFDTGILPRPKYISAIYDIDDEYDSLIKKINASKHHNKYNLKKRIVEYKAKWEFSNGADQILKKHISNERNFLIFCSNIQHLNKMIPVVINWFKIFRLPINIYKVYSTFAESEKHLNEFANEVKRSADVFNLLFSVEQLNEGLHVPNIQGVIFLRPTDSHIIYYQQLGRSLATRGNQPIVFDMVNNFKKSKVHTSFNKLEYSPVFSNDYLKNDYDKYKFSFNIIDETKGIRELFSQAEDAIHSWNILLENFILDFTKHKSYNKIKLELKQWMNGNRGDYKRANGDNSSVWASRVIKLNSLKQQVGFDWLNHNSYNDKWYKQFENFKEELEHKKAYQSLSKENKSWFTEQRKKYTKYNSSVVDNAFDMMNDLNPLLTFQWNIPINLSWIIIYSEIKKKLNNNSKLSIKQETWLQNQRHSSLTLEQKKLLNLLLHYTSYNYLKPKSADDIWNKKLLSIKKEVLAAGNYKEICDASKHFIARQKSLFKNNLTESRFKRQEAFNSFLHYIEQFQTFEIIYNNIKIKLTANLKLNRAETKWLNYQKTLFLNNELNPTRISELDLLVPYLKNDWKTNSKKRTFNEVLGEIHRLLEENKHIGQSNLQWLADQRVAYSKNLISKNKVQLLDNLNDKLSFDWKKGVYKSSFNNRFNNIEAKLKKHNYSILNKSDKEWLQNIRKKHKKKSLTQKQISKLGTLSKLLGFDWDEGFFNK